MLSSMATMTCAQRNMNIPAVALSYSVKDTNTPSISALLSE